MPKPTRLLGVDYGTVRIGLAVTDPDRIIASPLETYHCKDSEADKRYFQSLVEREEIGHIIVGLPMHTDGRIGQKAVEAQDFGKWLSDVTGIDVNFWDERFSTVEAERHLTDAGLTSKKRKKRRDLVAAQIILQSYLESGEG